MCGRWISERRIRNRKSEIRNLQTARGARGVRGCELRIWERSIRNRKVAQRSRDAGRRDYAGLIETSEILAKRNEQMKRIATALAICAAVLASGAVYATSYTWTGTTDTDWGTKTNWTPAGVPDSGDDATIDNSHEPANWPVLDQSRTIASLTMNGGQLDMDDGTARTLSVDGTFSIGANGATLGGSGGTIRAETWSIGGTTSFGQGTYECGAV